MNNAINEIENTLERTNSRITEAEDMIVQINEAERKKEKQEMTTSETSRTMLNTPTFDS